MMGEDIKDQALRVVRERAIFFMATIDRGTPRVRPMTCIHTDEFRIWTATHRNSSKIKNIADNNLVEACFLDSDQRQVRILGRVNILEDEESWAKLPSCPECKPMMEDPNYVLVLIEPIEVRFVNDWSSNYKNIPVLSKK